MAASAPGTPSSHAEVPWTRERHRMRHEYLHACLDELLADFIRHTGGLPSSTSVFQLLEWSHEQTQEPSLGPGEEHAPETSG